MSVFASQWNAAGEQAQQRRAATLARIAALRELEQRAAQASQRAKPQFEKRGQLLPRERVALLLDPGAHGCRCARWRASAGQGRP
jgi:geranyl-CoA carboxylase beta subunit